MCKWKIQTKEDGFEYITECNYLADNHEDETEYYEYCPYCGKIIDIEKEEEEEE